MQYNYAVVKLARGFTRMASSARASRVGGISMPIALAVFRSGLICPRGPHPFGEHSHSVNPGWDRGFTVATRQEAGAVVRQCGTAVCRGGSGAK
jgi:hypothetical protein